MKAIRAIFIVVLAGVFSAMGYYLYQKQKNQYNYTSFKVDKGADGVLLLHLDRLLSRIDNTDEFISIFPDLPFVNGINTLLNSNIQGVSELVGNSCYLSYSDLNFSVVFNKVVNCNDVVLFLSEQLNEEASYTEGELEVGGVIYQVQFFGDYTVFGNHLEAPILNQQILETGNVDYIVFSDTNKIEKHLITNSQSFKIWLSEEKPVRGKPVLHQSFMAKVPLNFDTVSFYGSTRFQEDQTTYFNESSEESVAWIDNGVLIIKKDSFQIMIAQQNESRDLKLMLEEQTLDFQSDSSVVTYFNVKNFEIMPFKTNFDWQKSIPALSSSLNYYTEMEDFNVMSNSIAAMRWYLAEIQIDNLFLKSKKFKNQYQKSLPLFVHKLNISKGNDVTYSSETWREKTKSTHTFTKLSIIEKVKKENDVLFPVDFEPIYIQLIEQNGAVLLTGKNKVAFFDKEGVRKWVFTSDNPIKQKPQIIDLENNGEMDFALFNSKGMIVLDHTGEPIEKLTLQNESQFREGICMNYDNKFDYRFLLINGDKIDYFNESGQIVEGWQFKQSTTAINSVLHYTQIQGKDYISFKDVSDNQYILNRRGEPRFPVLRQFYLANESSFLTGNNEVEMRKLGYKDQYIISYFVKDGYKDSVKLDKRVNPLKVSWLEGNGVPLLVIEEASRIMIFNTFGYLETEILKPEGMGQFLGVHKEAGFNYVFFNNSQNSLYLLDDGGKLRLKTNKTHSLYGLSSDVFCTYDGQNIKFNILN